NEGAKARMTPINLLDFGLQGGGELGQVLGEFADEACLFEVRFFQALDTFAQGLLGLLVVFGLAELGGPPVKVPGGSGRVGGGAEGKDGYSHAAQCLIWGRVRQGREAPEGLAERPVS